MDDMNRARITTTRSVGRWAVLGTMLLVGWGLGPAQGAEQTGPPGGGSVVAYDLQEIPSFDVPKVLRGYFLGGSFAECQAEPNDQVRHYPKFQSSKPLYGCLLVGAPYQHRERALHYQYALDESAGTGQGYDRLYLDANRNGDLTDDGPGRKWCGTPEALVTSPGSLKVSVCFEPVRIAIDSRDDSHHRVELMPHLRIYADTETRPFVVFVPTKARGGLIRIGDMQRGVFLGHGRDLAGAFDQPTTMLFIIPANQPLRFIHSWLGGQELSSTYRRGDAFYRFSATPEGDKLFVHRYDGPLGTLEIGAGGRSVTEMSLGGSVSAQGTAVLIADELDSGGSQAVRSCRLPAGDYCPGFLNATYGSLQFGFLRNYHADGQPRVRWADPPTRAIHIRADKPFVLDFSGPPQVLFALPARDQRIKLGQELSVKAVLIDPALDIMFRYISQEKQLDPKVVIKRANGAIVAEGVMPFG
jgi:hypothetical protein